MKKLILSMGAVVSISAMLSASDINIELNKLKETVKDIGGNTYRTVKIGKQV